MESVWWALSTLSKKGLLVEGYKIQPYCARCGTTLSSHEVAQNYKDADDPSVWVLFPARPGEELVTKRDLLRYTAQVAPTLLPYLTRRALNLHRYPNGAQTKGFCHKELPDHAPIGVDVEGLGHGF